MASAACCTLPPAKVGPYDNEGTHNESSGYKTYVTGPESASVGVFVVYDIFGFSAPAYQGADILSKYAPKPLVVIPDFFEGKPMAIENYPPNTPEKQRLIGDFFAGPAEPKSTVEKAKAALAKVQEAYPKVEKWVVVGFCWGGKIATLLGSQDLKGVVGTVQVHPAFLDAEDAGKLKTPHLAMMSKDESAEVVAKYKETFAKGEVKGKVSEYLDMHHGWMGARAKLEEEEFKKQYEKGYKELADFVASLA